jgi:stage III sporulation protein AA
MQKKIGVLKYFPEKIEKAILEALLEKTESLEEIRLRTLRPIILKLNNNEVQVKYIVSQEEILGIMQKICENSIYSYQNEIASGFVTLKGGHRVGISGSCVMENGKVININYIYSLNFRIARQVQGASNKVLTEVLNIEKNTVYNTLIVSAPGARKNNNFTRYCKAD